MSSIIVILGAPEMGNEIHAVMLAETSGLPQLPVGRLLRETARSKTLLGRELRLLQAAGRPVSDELIAQVLWSRTIQPDCADGYVLTDYPRTLEQARRLDEMAELQGREIRVYELTVLRPGERRQSVGRLTDYYLDSGRLMMINAGRAMEDVFFDLCQSATGWTSGA
ncbi:MAG TPA: nucleoside monophosphate kinase [Blastocatellia bacterium]|nr:nucleoside monophosphate kinase [Blastocatellia bacterium]